MTSRIGVLTSGGDAPAMNAAIAGVCEEAERASVMVVGFHRGYDGLSIGEEEVITSVQAHRYVHEAGTWLGSSRYPELRSQDGVGRLCQALRSSRGDALVVIGGDGSLQGARALAQAGMQVAFIPATIDNDIPGTEITIGVDSAVNYAVGVIDQLRITGRSLLGRAFLVQTLGGHTEHLARAVAAAASINDELVLRDSRSLERAAALLRQQAQEGEAIAVMPERIGNAVDIAARLEKYAGVRVHPSILGHAQRAAHPTARDRAIGLEAGQAAARVLLEHRSGFIALRADGRVATSETLRASPSRRRENSRRVEIGRLESLNQSASTARGPSEATPGFTAERVCRRPAVASLCRCKFARGLGSRW